jgi:UDP-N-acetylmuramoyl-L-alanyl-D-glutamate--2,6-diaminopimelate ligase
MKEAIRKFIPSFLIDRLHWFYSLLGAVFYGFSSRSLKVIGVTGTNGKTTTINLATKIFEEAGFKVVSLSSIKFKIGQEEVENKLKMTLPGRFFIQQFLKKAKDANCQFVFLEITSEGIKQFRHSFINFDTVLITNLNPEHIEAHGSFEKYREAKGKLFQVGKNNHILNLDDENFNYFRQFPAKNKIGYGIDLKYKTGVSEIIEGEDAKTSKENIEFRVENEIFRASLLGLFNIYNCLAAISIARAYGITLEICRKALEKVSGIPGRMEEVVSKPFKVFVDYAFTPNALEKVYQLIRSNFRPKKMICVLGATGGGRDKWKRPILGKLAAQYCDKVIVTDEDPYDEEPLKIISQVAEGASGKAEKILDRREAIKKALTYASPRDPSNPEDSGDSIIITGKGCEPWICVADGKKIPWDDRRVVKEEFEKLKL